jgi:hypothetical protein
MTVNIALVIDRPGWSFANIAANVRDYFTQKYAGEFDFKVLAGGTMANICADIAIVFKWDQVLGVVQRNKINKVITCLYDHVTWNQSPGDELAFKHVLRKTDFLGCGNQTLIKELAFRGITNDTPVFLIEDGVNTAMFKQTAHPSLFTVGWCGNAVHGFGSIKGLEIIKEACNRTKTELAISDTSSNRVIPLTAMPAWYERISTYICASGTEGTPNPVLEAMSCGRPVISTRVGITDRLITDGVNGFFVDRTAEDIAEKIQEIKLNNRSAEMGALARLAAEAYDWQFKMYNWRTLLSAAAMAL